MGIRGHFRQTQIRRGQSHLDSEGLFCKVCPLSAQKCLVHSCWFVPPDAASYEQQITNLASACRKQPSSTKITSAAARGSHTKHQTNAEQNFLFRKISKLCEDTRDLFVLRHLRCLLCDVNSPAGITIVHMWLELPGILGVSMAPDVALSESDWSRLIDPHTGIWIDGKPGCMSPQAPVIQVKFCYWGQISFLSFWAASLKALFRRHVEITRRDAGLFNKIVADRLRDRKVQVNHTFPVPPFFHVGSELERFNQIDGDTNGKRSTQWHNMPSIVRSSNLAVWDKSLSQKSCERAPIRGLWKCEITVFVSGDKAVHGRLATPVLRVFITRWMDQAALQGHRLRQKAWNQISFI